MCDWLNFMCLLFLKKVELHLHDTLLAGETFGRQYFKNYKLTLMRKCRLHFLPRHFCFSNMQ